MQIRRVIWVTDYRMKAMFATREESFRVTKMKNTTEHKIGDFISEAEVNSLIAANVDVIIKGKKK